MFHSPRTQTILVIGIAAVLGVAAYLFWPRSEERQLTESATTSSVATTSPTTTTTAVTTPVTTRVGTTTTQPLQEPEPTLIELVEPTVDEVAVDDLETPPTTTATPDVTVDSPPPDFNVIVPTHVWPDRLGASVNGPARKSVSVWDRIEAFWEWYMVEGHAQALSFDAATRPGLSPLAAEQINWVHRRFWSEILPTWDRVWNDEFAKEREQQREWLMIYHGRSGLLYNHPGDGIDVRYWGPSDSLPLLEPGEVIEPGEPHLAEQVLLPLMDLDAVKAWMSDRGRDLDAFTQEWDAAWEFDADFLALVHSQHFGVTFGWWDEAEEFSVSPTLRRDDDLWQEWARSVELESVLGPQAAGGKLGPEEGEMWYQWHPEGFDVSPLHGYPTGSGAPADDYIFDAFPDWWPERLEVPIHDPALYGVGGTIAPQNPNTGNFYFEVCLWASGGLFGPWSLPHPELPDASANTTWWVTGLADPEGTILEISLPRNRPCLYDPDRYFYEWWWEEEWNNSLESLISTTSILVPELAFKGQDDALGNERTMGRHRAYVDMLARNDLGSWLWREHPNPDSALHEWLGWEPTTSYADAPDVLGVMIHPLYLTHPDGTPAGYPGGDFTTPWKWWPLAPAYEFAEEHGALFRISIGGCHRPDEPYLWMESNTRFSPGITTDGGPVWAWPGVVEGQSILPFLRDVAENRQEEFGQNYFTPRTNPAGNLAGWGSYHPPVPCQDIADGKYEPDQVAFKVDRGTYEGWMPAVGDRPHPNWTDPDNPFTR